MSKKSAEEKDFEEFYKTPVGMVISTLGNYNSLISEMIKEHPDEEELHEEYDESSLLMKNFVGIFENFEHLDSFYIDDVNLVLMLLEKLSEEDRNSIFRILGTYIEILTRTAETSKNSSVLTDETDAVKNLYNITAPVFMKIDLGEESYKKLLRQIFRVSVYNAERYIKNPKNETDLDFGYEYKNYALILRSKMKTVKTDSDKIDFVFDFVDCLEQNEKDYFKNGILTSFIDCIQHDLDNQNNTFENELEYMSLARQVQWKLQKRELSKNYKS